MEGGGEHEDDEREAGAGGGTAEEGRRGVRRGAHLLVLMCFVGLMKSTWHRGQRCGARPGFTMSMASVQTVRG